MLVFGRHSLPEGEPARDSVHNYYERLVFEQILRASNRAQQEPNFCADVACVALNHLPPRYVRFDVDMSFFLSPVEMEEMTDKVAAAVNKALAHVEASTRE
jgi:hypothetical protein